MRRSITGRRISVLVEDGEQLRLASARVFADGAVELTGLPADETHDLDAFRQLVEAGRVRGGESAVAGARVHVEELGSFRVAEQIHAVAARDLWLELSDRHDELAGRPTSVDRCRAAYEAYLADPTVAGRDALRIAYESIAPHLRRYVGDMDLKDVAVRMIVYGEQELERWSHRIVAGHDGIEPLPGIRVPRPKDE